MSNEPLLQIPEVRKQPAHRKTYALHLIGRGADAALILFWINLVTGCYSHFPMAFARAEAIRYCELYPEFVADISTWWDTFESLQNTQKPVLCKTQYRTRSLPPSAR